MSVPEMRQWLRNWVANATGQSPDAIDESAPMVELGLSSRDAVAMATDIEDLTGVTLTATVAFRHPTIESLAQVIVEGEPEEDLTTRRRRGLVARPADVDDIAIVGLGTRFPGDMNTPDETWQALLEGRDAITDLPEGRWSEFLDEPRIAERVAKARTRGGYLTDIKGFDAEFFALSKMEADNIDPQQRMALELTWEALEHARIPASSLRGTAVGVFVGTLHQRLQLPVGLGSRPPRTRTRSPAPRARSSPTGCRTSTTSAARRWPSTPRARRRWSRSTRACKALRAGEADVVLAGGVNALITPLVTIGFDEVGGVLAPDGRIKSFSLGRRRLRPLRGRRHAGAQAGGRRPPRRRRDPRRHRGSARSTTTAGPTACSRPTPTRRPRCCARPTRTPASIRAPSTTSRRTAPAPSSATRSRPTRWAASSAGAVPPTSPRCWVR